MNVLLKLDLFKPELRDFVVVGRGWGGVGAEDGLGV